MNRLRNTIAYAAGLAFFLAGNCVFAANPATISVTVTIQNLSVSATGPIAFGVVAASTQTVSTTSSTVTNDGNVSETFSLKLTNPAGWTAVAAAPGAEEFGLLAMFSSAAPGAIDFSYANHSLTTSSVSSSGTKFAGDQTGINVPSGGANTRKLWFRFDAPNSTAVTTEQEIVVTITAAAS